MTQWTIVIYPGECRRLTIYFIENPEILVRNVPDAISGLGGGDNRIASQRAPHGRQVQDFRGYIGKCLVTASSQRSQSPRLSLSGSPRRRLRARYSVSSCSRGFIRIRRRVLPTTRS